MRLHIQNFAKISDADLRLDGITVIAGDNNTGKSTVGKVLYSIFRSLSNIDRRIVNERIRTVRNVLNRIPGVPAELLVAEQVLDGTVSMEEALRVRAERWLQTGNVSAPQSAVEGLVASVLPDAVQRLDAIRAASHESVGSVILLRVFDCVFHGQYHPLKPSDGIASITYTIRENGASVENSIRFMHDHAEIIAPVSLQKTVRLISDPNAMNLLNVRDFLSNPAYAKVLDKFVYELGEELSKPDNRTAVESAISREGLRQVLDQLQEVIADSVRTDANNNYVLREPGNSEVTKVENLSMGMKSFALVKTVLERQILSDRDVLILDEPEIHLHPEWQVVYAKAIVLLQKAYDLTVLLTSHSSVFVNAIQRYSQEAGLAHKTNFYLSHEDSAHPGFCAFDHLTSNTGPIYRGFNKSKVMLERLSGNPETAEEVPVAHVGGARS